MISKTNQGGAKVPVTVDVNGTGITVYVDPHDNVTISVAGVDVAGLNMEAGTVGVWPDGETWEQADVFDIHADPAAVAA